MQTIELMIDRRNEEIPVASIVYAQVIDKLCFIHLTNGRTIKIFITIGNLMKMLPEEQFLQINRGTLVAYSSIWVISDHVILFDGTVLNYSARNKKELIAAKERYLLQLIEKQGAEHEHVSPEQLAEEFRCFDRIPVAFSILEMMIGENGTVVDFIYRYANQAFAGIVEVPLEQIIGRTFYGNLFPQEEQKWLSIYSHVAYHGAEQTVTDHAASIGKRIHVQCFRPYYGFCATLVWNVTEKISGPENV